MLTHDDYRSVPGRTLLRRLVRLMVLFWGALFCLGLFGYWHISSWGDSLLSLPTPRQIDFPRGTSIAELAGKLEDNGVIDSALKFGLWVRSFSNYGRFQAGVYHFAGQVSPATIAAKITAGKIHQPVVLQFSVPEGFTTKQVAARLAAKKVASEKAIAKLMRDKTFIKELNVPSKTLEGFIYPATYTYKRKLTARQIIADTVRTFWKNLPANYETDAKDMGISLLDAVTFASLIELETQHEDEMFKVSEVIWRRLKKGSPIGIDAALIYGIEDYQGDIKWKHLKDRKNPYNTRIHKGLPPTPIGSPSRKALLAVLKPTNQGYYYYVLNTDSDNRHHFSKTSAEHRRYVKKLVEATKKDRRARPKR